MKLGRTAQIIGVILLIDGLIRMIIGIVNGNPLLILAGIITGLLLGELLVHKGSVRINRISEVNNG